MVGAGGAAGRRGDVLTMPEGAAGAGVIGEAGAGCGCAGGVTVGGAAVVVGGVGVEGAGAVGVTVAGAWDGLAGGSVAVCGIVVCEGGVSPTCTVPVPERTTGPLTCATSTVPVPLAVIVASDALLANAAEALSAVTRVSASIVP